MKLGLAAVKALAKIPGWSALVPSLSSSCGEAEFGRFNPISAVNAIQTCLRSENSVVCMNTFYVPSSFFDHCCEATTAMLRLFRVADEESLNHILSYQFYIAVKSLIASTIWAFVPVMHLF